VIKERYHELDGTLCADTKKKALHIFLEPDLATTKKRSMDGYSMLHRDANKFNSRKTPVERTLFRESWSSFVGPASFICTAGDNITVHDFQKK